MRRAGIKQIPADGGGPRMPKKDGLAPGGEGGRVGGGGGRSKKRAMRKKETPTKGGFGSSCLQIYTSCTYGLGDCGGKKTQKTIIGMILLDVEITMDKNN